MNRAIFVSLISAIAFASSAYAVPGVTDKAIRIASVNANTGPAAPNGRCLNVGAKILFDSINKQGGINGRTIELDVHDDMFEPAKTSEIATQLANKGDVFAFLNFLGTANAKAVLPLVERTKIPFLFPRTPDMSTREPVRPNVFNLKNSYPAELASLIDLVVGKLNKKKIAVLGQSDALGSAVVAGVQKALSKYSLKAVATGLMERNKVDVKHAFDQIAAANPDVVFLGVTASAGLPFVKMASANGKNWLFVSTSLNNPLAGKLEGINPEIILLQGVPDLLTSPLPIGLKFRELAKGTDLKGLDTFGVFEGFLSAAIFAEGLKRAGSNPTRENFIAALENGPIDLGGIVIEYSTQNHNGKPSELSSLTKIVKNKIVPF